MSDRNSAAIFGRVFEMLAENPTEEHKEMAKRLEKMSHEYDFSQCQMECNKALKALGVKVRRY